MLVSKRKYKELLTEHADLVDEHADLVDEHMDLEIRWSNLINRINAKGGESFLAGSNGQQFSKSEIRQLLFLCHPDKHSNSSRATEITVKLLELRRAL